MWIIFYYTVVSKEHLLYYVFFSHSQIIGDDHQKNWACCVLGTCSAALSFAGHGTRYILENYFLNCMEKYLFLIWNQGWPKFMEPRTKYIFLTLWFYELISKKKIIN